MGNSTCCTSMRIPVLCGRDGELEVLACHPPSPKFKSETLSQRKNVEDDREEHLTSCSVSLEHTCGHPVHITSKEKLQTNGIQQREAELSPLSVNNCVNSPQIMNSFPLYHQSDLLTF